MMFLIMEMKILPKSLKPKFIAWQIETIIRFSL